MKIEEKIKLIMEVGEEVLTEEELKTLFETKKHPIAYDGFEPSGTSVHIAQGLLRAININKMTKAGVKFTMLAADWHGWANNKLDGDLEKINIVGDYLIEVWKACDMDLDNVKFIRSTDLINNGTYWKTVMQVARNNTVKRITRCSQIMGRGENDSLQSSQILYPCMQCADIFEIGADITQLGMDQRKVNVLAREVGPKLGYYKPVVVSHHMLQGLSQPPGKDASHEERMMAMKMSKSKPDSAIFMNDIEADINRKVKKAYCPEAQVQENPILEYCKYIIFPKFEKSGSLIIERPEKWGGNLEFKTYAELEKAFAANELHPADLKQAVAIYLNKLLEPVRKKLEKNKKAIKLAEQIKEFKVTR
ncbi:tyrosine--tRNA ligase [Candidatus Woesearchaeota archaeon]|jgi:tyrosyl-tRNA synthetase|nr:tyrosine--tRNA ligase [Candidatus Woesearchaeota archaeon]